jgi:hypothetical protein
MDTSGSAFILGMLLALALVFICGCLIFRNVEDFMSKEDLYRFCIERNISLDKCFIPEFPNIGIKQ